MAVTTIHEIIAQANVQPEEITLSGWNPDSEITVRVKRPSFYYLIANKAALNPLIPELEKLFVRHDRSSHKSAGSDFAKALICIARECLVEPTFSELEEADVELTSDQLTELSLYATEGAEYLRTFRERLRARAGADVKNVSAEPQQPDAHRRSVHSVVSGSGNRLSADAPAERG